MQTCGQLLVKAERKLLFLCLKSSKKLFASNVCDFFHVLVRQCHLVCQGVNLVSTRLAKGTVIKPLNGCV